MDDAAFWQALVGAACAALWAAAAGHWAVARQPGLAALGAASALGVFVANPDLWQAAVAGYPRDSFWTLGTAGRLGVVAISASGIAVLYLAVARSGAGRPGHQRSAAAILAQAASGIAAFLVLYALSPQVFYALYRILIPTLPAQIVIRSPLEPALLAEMLALSPAGSLSAHLAGVSFIALPLFVVLSNIRGRSGGWPWMALMWLWLVVTGAA